MKARRMTTLATALALVFASPLAAAQEKAYRIGYIADLSGPFQVFYKPLLEAFRFYVDALNVRGGVNGIPVKLSIRDDQLNATRATSLVLELITSDDVNSIWGMSVTRTHMAVYRQAQRHEVPVVAMFSGIKAILPPKPIAFGYSAGHVFEVAGRESGRLAVKGMSGRGKVVCTSIETPGGIAACKFVEGAATAAGHEAGSVLFPPRTAEFSAVGQKMADMKPTMVVSHAAGFQNPGIVRAMRESGFDGPIVMGSHGLIEADLIKALSPSGYVNGLRIVSRFASPDSPGRELDDLRAAAKKHGKKDPLSTVSVMGWSLGRVMEAALASCGWPCPGKKLDSTLQGLSVDMGALMGGPVRFSEGDHYGPSWWRVFEYEPATRKFVPISDWLEAEAMSQ